MTASRWSFGATTAGWMLVAASASAAPLHARPATVLAEQARVPRVELRFIEEAALDNMVDVELGRIARQRGRSAQVKDFAARLVRDHGRRVPELNALAAGKGAVLAMSRQRQREIDRLGALSGDEFDRAFMRHIVAEQRKDVSAFERQARRAQDRQIRSYASRALPALQDELRVATATHQALQRGARSAAA